MIGTESAFGEPESTLSGLASVTDCSVTNPGTKDISPRTSRSGVRRDAMMEIERGLWYTEFALYSAVCRAVAPVKYPA